MDMVLYNGAEMTAEWPAKIEQAQREIAVTVAGRVYGRIPYGQEYWCDEGWKPQGNCRDCGVLVGQYHVEGCCLERCPLCREGQRLFGCEAECAELGIRVEHIRE